MKILFAPDTALAAPPAAAPAPAPTDSAPPTFMDDFSASVTDPATDEPTTRPGTPEKKPDPAPPTPELKPDPKPDPKPATDLEKGKPGKGQDGIKQLREAHEKVSGELKSERESRLALEAKIKDYEARGKDTEKLAERLTQVEKERDERIAELRGLRQEMSPEFKATYEAPLEQTAADTKDLVQSMEIEVKDEDGTVTGTRKADWKNDFVRLFNMPRGLALKEAKRVFGDDADIVRGRLDQLWAMNARKTAAEAQERTNWKANEEKRQAQSIAERSQVEEMWVAANQDLATKEPEWYAADAIKDPKEKEILTKAFTTVDSRHNPNLPLNHKVQLDAQVRHRAAAYGLARHRLGKAEARIKELEVALEQAKGSKPGGGSNKSGGGVGNGVPTDTRKSLMSEFDEAVTGR